MVKIAKELPLEQLTLRKYEKPFRLEGRQLIKKFCLSLGILQPGDSRDIVVDVMHVLLQNKTLTASETENAVREERKKHNLPMLGITGSNIRRQLRRLQDIHLVDRQVKSYVFAENLPLTEAVSERTIKTLLGAIVERVQEYAKTIEEKYGK
ncbi:MAG: hypothetical protein HY363_05385 [Candidatus Aenigmarchaeota archaeon]|nr:hypothetical protein [Candidatus Aenigmarchaeota archaeon]